MSFAARPAVPSSPSTVYARRPLPPVPQLASESSRELLAGAEVVELSLPAEWFLRLFGSAAAPLAA